MKMAVGNVCTEFCALLCGLVLLVTGLSVTAEEAPATPAQKRDRTAEERLAEAMGLRKGPTAEPADSAVKDVQTPKPVDVPVEKAKPVAKPKAEPEPKPSPYPIGERLVYIASVKKAGVSAEVGEAVFTVTESDGHAIISATAQAEKLGYTIDTEITTVIDSETLRPVTHRYHQKGSETRDKKLIFSEDGAVYWKVKHCRDESCQDPAHMIKKTRWVGIIPWGSKTVHCNKRSCDDPDHACWRERAIHMFDQPCRDMLSALYEARTLDFDSDEPKTIAVVNDRDRWDVELIVKETRRLEVKAGTFDAVRVVLNPVAPEKGSVPDKFEGLFGLHGSINVWLDRETRRPLKVAGIIPIGPLDIDASVELSEIGTVPDRETASTEATRSGTARPANSGK